MFRFGKILGLFIVILNLAVPVAPAFSLLGPYEPWMQPTNGFQQPGDIGGPMNLGEEYRWNVPVLTYAFDASFLDYFGSNGVWAVEQAIQILNDLPPASQLDPASYPTEALHFNYQAQALNLTDLKSKTLAVLLEQLGLAQPTRHTFCVRHFFFYSGGMAGQTVKRNFDPFTFAPTNWVNDTAYGYLNQLTTNGLVISLSAEEYPLDPLDNIQTTVADGALQAGQFYTGLTRDDVGGLRYVLHTNNLNLEFLLPGVHGIGFNSGWAYADLAVRPGMDKITLVRRDYDFFTGQFFTPYTNQFTDYFLYNNTIVTQQLERVSTTPDILFCAGNSGIPGLVNNALVARTGTTNWLNCAFPPGPAGPGIIRPPIKVQFSHTFTSATTSDLWTDATVDYVAHHWASYDLSTNAPVIYPEGNAGSDLTLNLQLLRNNTVIGRRSWQIPLAPQESIVVETSGDLVNWIPYLVLERLHK